MQHRPPARAPGDAHWLYSLSSSRRGNDDPPSSSKSCSSGRFRLHHIQRGGVELLRGARAVLLLAQRPGAAHEHPCPRRRDMRQLLPVQRIRLTESAGCACRTHAPVCTWSRTWRDSSLRHSMAQHGRVALPLNVGAGTQTAGRGFNFKN
jgi:hypothetical protein